MLRCKEFWQVVAKDGERRNSKRGCNVARSGVVSDKQIRLPDQHKKIGDASGCLHTFLGMLQPPVPLHLVTSDGHRTALRSKAHDQLCVTWQGPDSQNLSGTAVNEDARQNR